jgi:DUF1680 family protein
MMLRQISIALCGLFFVAGEVRAYEPAVRLTPVPIQSVKIDDPFWSPKLAVWRRVTIADCLDKFDWDGALRNFDHVARGELSAEHGGPPWYDGLIYEMIRASGDFLAEQPDAELEARVDGMIDRISAAAAHDPDGYLNTYTQMKEPGHRWGQNGGNDRWQHDLYNAGCMVEAGVHYYRATGKTKLLETAVRMANLMSKVMGPPPRQNIIPGHAIGEEAMIEMWRLFKEQPGLKAKLKTPVEEENYLALGKFWIDARGHHEGRTSFGAYDQDREPVLQQTAIEGHAVRAALMCSGLTSLGMVTDSPEYAGAAKRLWENMAGKRMYITGGVGSYAGDEKFAGDYVLPNNGYLETCAAVANGFFDRNMNLATGDAVADDELERTLYNGALAGVSLSGNRYFYENPLEASRGRLRWPWHACPCCPPMFLKMMSALPGYIYATDSAKGVYVNLFVGSSAKIDVAGGTVRLKQETSYPWDGFTQLKIEAAGPSAFDLYVRVPGWRRDGKSFGGLYSSDAGGIGASFSVNGKPERQEMVRGYARLRRAWKSGDVISVSMPMSPMWVHADERVEADRGRVALMRGPLVYCLESADNGGSVRDLYVSANEPPKVVQLVQQMFKLGGETEIVVKGQRVGFDGRSTDVEITAIPYYANANRGPVSMEVWIPTDASRAVSPTIATLATPSASHVNPSDSIWAMNDGAVPKNSGEQRSRFTWWDHKGTSEWVLYDLDKQRKVSGVEVYWFDDSRTRGGCRLPESWRLLYKTGEGKWELVAGKPEFGTAADKFNTVRFDAVETTALRIEVQLRPGFSGGIQQWRVLP